MIIHSVIFKLKYAKGSDQERVFLETANQLSAIPGVNNLQSYRQTNKKNGFSYGLSMEFETSKAYKNYNEHPSHKAFIQDYWIDGVEEFLEIDYEPLSL
jgi:heme-degrading monooxygenase HmoA